MSPLKASLKVSQGKLRDLLTLHKTPNVPELLNELDIQYTELAKDDEYSVISVIGRDLDLEEWLADINDKLETKFDRYDAEVIFV